MTDWKRYAAGAIGLAGLFVALAALQRGVPGDADAAVAVSSGVVAAAAAGWYQHSKDASGFDERSMHIRYRAGYVAFWAMFWFQFVFVVAAIGEGETGGVAYGLPVEAHTVAFAAWILGAASLFVARSWYKRQF